MWNFPKGMSNISDAMSDNNRVNSIDYKMAATYLLNYLYCFLGWFFFFFFCFFKISLPIKISIRLLQKVRFHFENYCTEN